MDKELTMDADAAARHTRFGKLPERIRFEDMTEEILRTCGPADAAGARGSGGEAVPERQGPLKPSPEGETPDQSIGT